MSLTAVMAAPEPVTVTRWRCPFCRRSRAHKAATARHINRCWLNPAVRSCKTCAHYVFDPGGESCFPGHPCSCNEGGEWCHAGIELDSASTPHTGCPLWSLRGEPA